ncbi:WW domain containing protein [Novymonas esmeraldas]|uniref:WW domain containing protein n=1 Tax=Novymonas esmeraldas TaxID=1808958 RepID=A0AAW0EQS3_9TRYP
MHLLVDGDYLLTGFRPTSDDEVKAAVDRLMAAVEQQLLQPAGAGTAATSIISRIIFFSSALLGGLEAEARACLVSSLRRLRFQTHVMETVRGRAGTPVDAALCTKLLQLTLLSGGGGGAAAAHAVCLVAPQAYLATALELLASRESCEVVFAAYAGDEVAEEMLGYASARYGATGGVATMPKGDGVAYLPSTQAAIAALALVHEQERGRLSIAALTELSALQTRLQQQLSSNGNGAIVAMPKAQHAAAPPVDAPHTAAPLSAAQPTVATAPAPSSASDDGSCADSCGVDDRSEHLPPPPSVPNTAMRPQQQQQQQQLQPWLQPSPATAAESLFESGTLRVTTTATSPPALQFASPPTAEPPSSMPPLERAAAAALGEPVASTTLPAEWALLYDPVRLRHYYACTDTTGRTRSTWQHPLGAHKQQELEAQVHVWRASKSPSQQQSQQQSQPQPQPQPSGALPDGWEERTHPQTGRIFYVDHRSKKTTWERPSNPSSAATTNIASVAKHVVAGGTGAAELPAPWEACVDPQSGRTFYVNHDTKSTTWHPPSAVPSSASSAASVPTTAAAPPPPLPPNGHANTGGDRDWVPRVDVATGRTFYVNEKTRQTRWTPPTSAAPWEARVDPQSGRTFYVNHDTKTTSWQPPTL